ncbi:MAG: hypothetical protein KGI51_02395 [Rhodospirillales bacterium]|nr:hypothetical protein [Rhodospirillales bacterium]
MSETATLDDDDIPPPRTTHMAVYVHSFLVMLFQRFLASATEHFVPKPRIVLVLKRLQRLTDAFVEAVRTPMPPKPEPRPRPEASEAAAEADAKPAEQPAPAEQKRRIEPPLDRFLPRSSRPHLGLATNPGWLCALAAETASCRTWLRELLADRELRGWLDADWRMWPILRPIAHMLGVPAWMLPPPEPHLRWPPRPRGKRAVRTEAPEGAPDETPDQTPVAEIPPELRGFESFVAAAERVGAERLAEIEAKAKAEANPPPSANPPRPYIPAPGEVMPPPLDWNARDLLTEVKNWGRKKTW